MSTDEIKDIGNGWVWDNSSGFWENDSQEKELLVDSGKWIWNDHDGWIWIKNV